MATPPIDHLADEPSREMMRGAIAENGGDEVFFLGRIDAEGRLNEVVVAARGHATAVPAILSRAAGFDCALHNHPNGDLRPSEADLDVASALGNEGLAFYIVDNALETCRVVVPHVPPRPAVPLDDAEIEQILGPDGPLAQKLDGYEARPEQVEMARAVARAFVKGQILLVEAGTGTGKSLAYLVPAVLWAVRRAEKLVISTATINLQEQLIGKDIPLLCGEGLPEFRSTLIKGRGNYLSKRRTDEARVQAKDLFDHDGDREELQRALRWAEQTTTGDRSEVPHPPSSVVWERLESTSDNCLRTRCPTYGTCHYFGAREGAAAAHLLVANHHLLFSDLAIKQQTGDFSAAAVLPAFRHLVLDEAHHVEDTASSHFGARVTSAGLRRQLGRLVGARRRNRGVLPALLKRCARTQNADARRAIRLIEEEALPAHAAAVGSLDFDLSALVEAVVSALPASQRQKSERRLRLRPAPDGDPLWDALEKPLKRLGGRIAAVASPLGRAAGALEGIGDDSSREGLVTAAMDLRSAERRLLGARTAISAFLQRQDTENVRWIELRRRRRGSRLLEGDDVSLHLAPLEVGPLLRAAVFERVHAAVLSSATLAVGGSFDYVKRRLGLDDLPEGRVTELVLGASFDYATSCALGVPSDLPEPNEPGYAEAVEAAVLETVRRSRGRAFVLFTSFALLRRVHDALAPTLLAEGLVPLRQGDQGRTALLERFRHEVGAVLFGTDSFWEGVDVKGDALSVVIITRLPFRVPDEPLWQARAEALKRRGGDPFMELTVPQAVLKFRQGFGRLIRSRRDRGAILVLDRRVVTRGYGRTFLRSLPEGVPVEQGPLSEVLDRLGPLISASSRS